MSDYMPVFRLKKKIKLKKLAKKTAYQNGFDAGARWGYNTGRMDERYGKPPYDGIKNVVPLAGEPPEPAYDPDIRRGKPL